jgi:nucleotide-binding universal stress UspA family protein
MYRNFLVHIPTERSARAAVDASVSLALCCGSRVDAVAAGFESTNVLLTTAEAVAVASIYEEERERALERATAALGIFETEAKRAEITYRARAISGTFIETASILGSMARLHDLTIVSQPELAHNTFDNQIPQEILFQSGGPVLFIPYIFHGAFSAARIGICWNGSRLAARALRDAMPFISHADALTAISINETDVPAEASQGQLIKYLADLGLPAKAASLEVEHDNIQSAILSIAAEENLDLLVMGGYGHTRLKETVLGGVTREMLRCMTVPTLMSH